MSDREAKTADIRRRALRVAARFAAIAAVVYAVGFVPIVPFLPVCHEEGPDGPVRRTLFGRMSEEFAQGLRHQQYPEGKWALGNMIFMTAGEWIFGFWYPYEITKNAIWYVIYVRHGVLLDDAFERRVGLPAFHGTWPTCEAVRAIALDGGKWSREGPSPIWHKAEGQPRPLGFEEGHVPNWWHGDPWTSNTVELQVWLAMSTTFGIALGYLLAIWRGRDMVMHLLRGLVFGLLFSVLGPLIFYFAIDIAYG